MQEMRARELRRVHVARGYDAPISFLAGILVLVFLVGLAVGMFVYEGRPLW